MFLSFDYGFGAATFCGEFDYGISALFSTIS
jgi:hypothetical protein